MKNVQQQVFGRIFSHHARTFRSSTSFMKLCYLILMTFSTFDTTRAGCPNSCMECSDTRYFCVGQNFKTFLILPATVTDVFLINDNISSIPIRAFQNLVNIKQLNLASNKLYDSSMWDGIFNKSVKLEYIDLNHNKLTKLSKSLVSGLPNLARLYLQNNLINTIEKGALDNLPNLVELKISNNLLRSFPALSSTPKLLLIEASYNRITKLGHQAFERVNLEKLTLGNNRLTEFQNLFDQVDHLEHLDVSSNRLTAVPRTIRSLTHLITLNVSNNDIDVIPTDAFKGHTNLKDLDITNMDLTTLKREVIPRNIVLNFLRMSGNQWKCDCELAWLYDYIQNLPAVFADIEHLTCANIRGKRLDGIVIGRDINCAGVKPAVANLPSPSTTAATTTTRRKPTVNACDVFLCNNGGTCRISRTYQPECICPRGYKGQQCQIEPYRPTTAKTTTTTRNPLLPSQGQLMINPDSITENSVQIILPRVSDDLTVYIKEKMFRGMSGVETQNRIQPTTNLYTIQGLEAGRTYNICISIGNALLRHDVLCGVVKMKGDAVYEAPIIIPKLSPIKTTAATTTVETATKAVEKVDNQKQTVDARRNNEMNILYPALGAGCGVLFILVTLLLFFMCYRTRRAKKNTKHSHNNNNTDTIYIPGTASDGMHARYIGTDVEMSPMTQHNGNGSMRNGGMMANGPNNQRKGSHNQQHQRLAATPNSSSSGSSSNSNCGTLPPQQLDNSFHYQQTHMNGNLKNGGESVAFISPNDVRGNEYVHYRTPSQSSPTHALHATHYDANEDMRPLMMQQHNMPYYPQEPTPPMAYMQHPPNTMPQHRGNYTPITTNGYTYPGRNEVIGYSVGDLGNPQHHQKPFTTRSAFQPIPNHVHTTPMTIASQCAPVMTHINAPHVLPVTSGIGMNGHLYQEGVA